ncbi:MAG: polyphosphate kinase [Saprospirales bacterium]|nr:polyphosphate kinase [Saprospirales bacterium]
MSEKNYLHQFDHPIRLADCPTDPPTGIDDDKVKDLTKDLAKELGKLNNVLMAEKKHSVLVVLQGMDASGKDGAVENVFHYCTPSNLQTYSYKKPTELEFAHDFLWRVHQQCPAKGEIGIFIRSHYEDVLIQRVHGWIDEKRVKARMDAINAFENLLQFDNNTLIFKFFLHISYEQQEKELKQREVELDKMWKHNPNDWKERECWSDYMRCYEDVLNNSTIPWTIVPVDKRWYRDYVILKTLVDKLSSVGMEYPGLPKGL